jgi:predicted nuclease of predicted toxin-antitoxin system
LRILANENIPGQAISALKEHGHDIVWTRLSAPGSPDEAVLARAQAENRVIITFDKDFGELAFKRTLPSACGVILFRISTPNPDQTALRIVAILQSRADWSGYFSVVENDRVRMTPLPIL